MTDLAIQPRDSLLTLATEPMLLGRRWYCWAVCFCGQLMRVKLPYWRDGSWRPRSCQQCARKRCKAARSNGRHRRSEPFGSAIGFRRAI